MNYRIILFLLGNILRVEAIFMLPAVLVSYAYQEWHMGNSFAVTILLLLTASLVGGRKHPEKIRFYAREGLVVVALVWVVVSLFGALPFYISGEIPHYVDALFEIVSGFTTTGASILTNVEAMPHGLLYWRSFSHWLGGMGVLVFLLAILPMAKGTGYSMHIMRAESPGPQVGKLMPKMRQTATVLYSIYVGLTILQFILLVLGGMPLFDSVCTAFGTAGTGGFGVKNDSMAGYAPHLQWNVTIFMALFGINFNIFFLLILREFSKAFSNEELRAYLGLMIGAGALITMDILPLYGTVSHAMRDAFFQVSSVMTTTGFATADFNLWPEFSRTILVLLMVVGASAGSTGGGIKVARLLLLIKNARRGIQKVLSPRTIKLVRMDGATVEDDTINSLNIYMAVYCLILTISMLLISIDNFSLETNLTAVLACLNNIGPGLGNVGPTGNFSEFSVFSKLVLSLNMLIGRLEIFPMLILMFPSTWKN
ncbi:MAG: TrkH family potassium uptake protein [Anaerotruncus sp.]|nr:TrkH family potassium uptake protein [Anaerotruncus sp.]